MERLQVGRANFISERQSEGWRINQKVNDMNTDKTKPNDETEAGVVSLSFSTALFDMDSCLSLSPYAKWKKWLTEEKGVLTHYADHMEDEETAWSAFVGGWDTVMSSCAIMEETGQMKFGSTEREALEKLAMSQGWPDDYEFSNAGGQP